uniref:Uncharacterized protein n=1 Tax=Meloidogyne incognita TaxID=6306 RepID=A0A914M5H8_MELIC
MDKFKGEKQANQKEITKNETIEQQKIEGKQEQQNIFPKINQILMKPPQQPNHNIGKDMLEMVTSGLQKRGVKIPQKAQKVIKKYSKNFQKIGQSSDDVEGQSDPQENVGNKIIKNDIEYMNEKEEEIFRQLMETRSKFQQKKNKEKHGNDD